MAVRDRPRRVVPVPLTRVAAASAGVLADPGPAVDVVVTGVSLSSQRVVSGDLYVGAPGTNTHGARFAADALRAGAAALLTDPAGAELAAGLAIPMVVVADPRAVAGAVSALVYGEPARELTVIAVTGTQGKTTTTRMIEAALGAAGGRIGVIGTVGTTIAGRPVASALTTPEAPELHALLAVMREEGVRACAMEVSSHALVMGRVNGCRFDLAVFTNFGRDHLDFHGTVEDYFAAKAGLFTPERAARALLNADDAAVAGLAAHPLVPTRTFSATGGPADWRAVDASGGADGSEFTVEGPGPVRAAASTPLTGSFNVANALAAISAAVEVGADLPTAVRGLAGLDRVPGRMERIDAGQPFQVFVDYAHKPDAVRAALTALRPVTRGRLTIVLGAGGDRDRGKRPLMGEVAARLADVVVVTDDNPRSEDPADIRAAILAGARSGPATVLEVGDRRTAIEQALSAARAGDAVLIAGKGHESGQVVGAERLPFDDRVVAREVLTRQLRGDA